MSHFTSCLGKTACRDDGVRCTTCNRSLAEIEKTRALIDALSDFVCTMGYDNVGEFTAYVANKTEKKVKHRRDLIGA